MVTPQYAWISEDLRMLCVKVFLKLRGGMVIVEESLQWPLSPYLFIYILRICVTIVYHVVNLCDINKTNYVVQSCVPEILDSVAEFEAPASPESSYSQALPSEEDYAKEPLTVPSQLHLTLLGTENSDEASSSKPKHVVLNHVFVDDGWKSKSVVALGLTHRFQSKYVTVVLYKPHKR